MKKRLIINADDLGFSREITDGILLAHSAGVVTSTSLMINQPSTEYAVAQLVRYPKLDVGIHLTLSEGAPVLPADRVPTLVGHDGRFLNAAAMQSALMTWSVSGGEVEAEFRAQIHRSRALGIDCTHADSHCHMHLFGAAVLPFRRALRAEGICSVRSPRIRYWPDDGRLGGAHAGSLPRRVCVRAYMDALASCFAGEFVSPVCRIELNPKNRGVDLSSMLVGWRKTFASLNRGGFFEMVCHPGLEAHVAREFDPIHDKRVVELALLTDPAFAALLVQNDVELASFPDLLEAHQIAQAK